MSASDGTKRRASTRSRNRAPSRDRRDSAATSVRSANGSTSTMLNHRPATSHEWFRPSKTSCWSCSGDQYRPRPRSTRTGTAATVSSGMVDDLVDCRVGLHAADLGLAGRADLRRQREVTSQELGLRLPSARGLGGEVAVGRGQALDAPVPDPVGGAGDRTVRTEQQVTRCSSPSRPVAPPPPDAMADHASATAKPMASATDPRSRATGRPRASRRNRRRRPPRARRWLRNGSARRSRAARRAPRFPAMAVTGDQPVDDE